MPRSSRLLPAPHIAQAPARQQARAGAPASPAEAARPDRPPLPLLPQFADCSRAAIAVALILAASALHRRARAAMSARRTASVAADSGGESRRAPAALKSRCEAATPFHAHSRPFTPIHAAPRERLSSPLKRHILSGTCPRWTRAPLRPPPTPSQRSRCHRMSANFEDALRSTTLAQRRAPTSRTPKYRACADAGIKVWRDASRGERRYFAQRSAEEMASLPAADGPRG